MDIHFTVGRTDDSSMGGASLFFLQSFYQDKVQSFVNYNHFCLSFLNIAFLEKNKSLLSSK